MIKIKFKEMEINVERDFKMSDQQFLALPDDQKLVLLDEHIDSISIHSSRIITDDHITGKRSGAKK